MLNYWYFRLKSSNFAPKHVSFEELLSKHYVNNFNISKTFEGFSNSLQNFTFMRATVFEIAVGCWSTPPPPLVKDVGTKRLGKGRVKYFVTGIHVFGCAVQKRKNIHRLCSCLSSESHREEWPC